MSNHTSGEWKYYWRQNDEGRADCGVFFEPREGQANSVCRAPQYQTKEQWIKDAKLIAAAPELLEALTEVLQCLEYAYRSHPEITGKSKAHSDMQKARAAIKKATS